MAATFAELLARLTKDMRVVVVFDDEDLPSFSNGDITDCALEPLYRTVTHLGAVVSQVEPLQVRSSARSMTFVLADHAGVVTTMLHEYELRGQVVEIRAGFDGLAYDDYEPIFKGIVTGYRYNAVKIEWTFSCSDLKRELRKTIFTTAADTAVTHVGTNPIDFMLTCMTSAAPNGMAIDAGFINADAITDMRDDYYSSLTMDFDVREPWDGWDFIEEQIGLPLGFYLVTDGDGKISVKHVHQPLWSERNTTIELDDSNIIGVPTVEHSLTDLLNEIFWKVDYDADTDEYDTKTLNVDSDSLTAYRQSKRVDIESMGLDSSDTTFIETRNALLFARFSEPYPRYKVKALLTTMQLREGDVVKFRHSALPDLATGEASMTEWHLCEVLKVSAQLGLGGGSSQVEIELLDTPWSFTKTIVVSPSTMTSDYDDATDDDHQTYGWIADTSDQLGTDNDEAYVILEG